MAKRDLTQPSLAEQFAMGMAMMNPQYAMFAEMLTRQRQMALDRQEAHADRRLARDKMMQDYGLGRAQLRQQARLADQRLAYDNQLLDFRRGQETARQGIADRTMTLAENKFEMESIPASVREYQAMSQLAGGDPLMQAAVRTKYLGSATGDLLMDLVMDPTIPLDSLAPIIETRGRPTTQVSSDGSRVTTPDRRDELMNAAMRVRGTSESALPEDQAVSATAAATEPVASTSFASTNIPGGPAADPRAHVPPDTSRPNRVTIDAQTGRIIDGGQNTIHVPLGPGLVAPMTLRTAPADQVPPGEPNVFVGNNLTPMRAPPSVTKGVPIDQALVYAEPLNDWYETYGDDYSVNSAWLFEVPEVERRAVQDVQIAPDGTEIAGPEQFETSDEALKKYKDIHATREQLRSVTARLYDLINTHGNYNVIPSGPKGEIDALTGQMMNIWRAAEATGSMDKNSTDAFLNMMGVSSINQMGDWFTRAPGALAGHIFGGKDASKDKALRQIATIAHEFDRSARDKATAQLDGTDELQAQLYERFTPYGSVNNVSQMQLLLEQISAGTRRKRNPDLNPASPNPLDSPGSANEQIARVDEATQLEAGEEAERQDLEQQARLNPVGSLMNAPSPEEVVADVAQDEDALANGVVPPAELPVIEDLTGIPGMAEGAMEAETRGMRPRMGAGGGQIASTNNLGDITTPESLRPGPAAQDAALSGLLSTIRQGFSTPGVAQARGPGLQDGPPEPTPAERFESDLRTWADSASEDARVAFDTAQYYTTRILNTAENNGRVQRLRRLAESAGERGEDIMAWFQDKLEDLQAVDFEDEAKSAARKIAAALDTAIERAEKAAGEDTPERRERSARSRRTRQRKGKRERRSTTR